MLTVLGASGRDEWLERDVAAKAESKPSVTVMPFLSADCAGLGLTGRF